jgi:hypothetical protein
MWRDGRTGWDAEMFVYPLFEESGNVWKSLTTPPYASIETASVPKAKLFYLCIYGSVTLLVQVILLLL